jgi:predicted RNA-binding Zn ribbon-like protein
LNQKLLSYPHRYTLTSKCGVIERRTYLEPANAEDLWREFAASAAHLFTDIPANRVRQCEGCVVNFYDISKKGSRRWCSMQMCGNRDKVATYRQKQRAREA